MYTVAKVYNDHIIYSQRKMVKVYTANEIGKQTAYSCNCTAALRALQPNTLTRFRLSGNVSGVACVVRASVLYDGSLTYVTYVEM